MGVTTIVKSKSEPDLSALCRHIAETSPMPMAAVEGPSHIVGYVNPAFCHLTGKTKEALIGKAISAAASAGREFTTLLERVYKTGNAEVHTGQEHPDTEHLYWLVLCHLASSRRRWPPGRNHDPGDGNNTTSSSIDGHEPGVDQIPGASARTHRTS